jgi:hypothetical protein
MVKSASNPKYGIGIHRKKQSRFLARVQARRIRRISMTFVPVGPVRIRPPAAPKKEWESLAERNAAGSNPRERTRRQVAGPAQAPAASVGPSIPSVPQKRPKICPCPIISIEKERVSSVFLPPFPPPVTVVVVSPPKIRQAGFFTGISNHPYRAQSPLWLLQLLSLRL